MARGPGSTLAAMLAPLLVLLTVLPTAPVPSSDPLPPAWRAALECPGGEIPFRLELAETDRGLVAVLVNGVERRTLERVERDGTRLVIHCDPYDSRLEAKLSEDGRTMTGEWIRYRTADTETRLPFRATAGAADRFPPTDGAPSADRFAGRWRVEFSSSEDPAVAIFEGEGAALRGTFLTTLGDYRYLAGDARGSGLRLSVFDGAHAFLFTAQLDAAGRLAGEFWSRDSWHETWTAERAESAALPDAFALTHWTGAVPLEQLVFPDLEGERRSLADPAFAGKARLIVLFGSWCPNCYDQSAYLVELRRRYGEAGLAVQGLAFEFGDDLERQTRVLERYRDHHGIDYPILVAGTSDKAAASAAFPVLDRVRSYPTTIFLDRTGRVRAVYTGFSGPATGAEHARLKQRFEGLIEDLLAGR